MGCVYAITSAVDGKVYVGQTTYSPQRRWKRHTSQLRTGKHFNPHLQGAWNKYGSDNFAFSVLLADLSLEALDDAERSCIAQYHITSGVYNLTSGGNERKVCSEETRRKISEATTGRSAWNKGKHTCSEGHRSALRARMLGSKIALGYRHTPEMRLRRSLLNAGNKFMLGKHVSEAAKAKISAANRGRPSSRKGIPQGPMSDATRLKMSKSHTGYKFSDEAKHNMSEARKRRCQPSAGCNTGDNT